MEVWSWCVLLACVTAVHSGDVTNMDEAKIFMERYNYMGKDHPDPNMRDLTKQRTIDTALLDYQANMGLQQTGILDDATKTMMSQPRCGNRDKGTRRDIMKRRRRFALQGFVWSSSTITYRFNSYSQDLSRADVERIIDQAFKLWGGATNLRFVKVDSNRDALIEIDFASGSHGDQFPFDGKGGTLAHAFFPNFGGEAHFDEAEQFTDGIISGINLLFVAVHEFGHSLGLEHSDIQQAIMFPTYLGYRANLKLHSDDIAGIQALYGKPPTTTTRVPNTTPTSTARPTTTSAAQSAFCQTGTVDAIGVLGGVTYVFQGEKYVRIDRLGIVSGYPRNIKDDWPGLPDDVDAVLDSPLGDHVFIFNGSKVWRYTSPTLGSFRLTTGYPKSIGTVFQDLPNDIDLAFVWSGNGRSYIFKGNQYYRLNVDRNRVLRTYPKNVSLWNLPPQGYSAAFQATNRRTFFFYGDQFYRYNDARMEVDMGYPVATRSGWLLCTNDQTDVEIDKNPAHFPTVGGPVSSGTRTVSSVVVIAFWILMQQNFGKSV